MKEKQLAGGFKKSNLRFTFLFLILLFPATVYPQAETQIQLESGWEFYKGDLASPWEAIRTGRPAELPIWEKVQIPHCYNAFDAVDPDVEYYEGAGWYRTYLDIENPYPSGRTVLHFEGAGQKTRVYVAEFMAAEHTGGYDEFTVDLTPSLIKYSKKYTNAQFNGKVPILIRTDNSRDTEMIPSDMSDFNLYGGVYRYLNLKYLPQVSLRQLHLTPELSSDLSTASVNIEASLYNPDKIEGKVSLKLEVFSPEGEVIHTKKLNHNLSDGNLLRFKYSIMEAQLWSPADPRLYSATLICTLENESSELSSNFGLRQFEFVSKGPFKLNGERLLLQGTHRHEDHAGVGAAMTEEMISREMHMMKEMGVNFIRLGHYQQSRIVLDLCDELGILVWEEIPWCRGGLGGETYKAQARRMLTNMIDQHYNHPAVIIWGLGNENDWPGDFEEFDEEKIRNFMTELNNLSHSLDPSRKTAIRRCAFCADIVDVYSPSIWAGWYQGRYTNYMESSRNEMEKVNHFLHVEWGASSHAGRHSEDPDKGLDQIASSVRTDERDGDFLLSGGEARVSRDGDWTESYAVNLIDWHLKEQEKMDWLTGTAYWIFKDFSTPLRPENPIPFVNQKGVVQRDLRPKESYYVFQSYWTQKPMARIYGHSWPTRWGDKNGKNMVKVYSNCPNAELFLNGESQGKRIRDSQDFPAAGLRWIVSFNEGENSLKVLAEKDGTMVEDLLTLNYAFQEWGAPSGLIFEEIERSNDTATLRVMAVDHSGNLCLDATSWVRFGIAGDGALIDNLGTSDGSRRIQMYNGQARIRVKLNTGESFVSVNSEGLPTAFCRVRQNPVSRDTLEIAKEK